jgi:dipeptidyl aminopeptidase/acylaminoacyl peptidase
MEISDPFGSPLRLYNLDDSFKSLLRMGGNWLSVSPDEREILLLVPVGGKYNQAWLLPYPPGSGSPQPISILSKLPFANLPTSSWMPDGRNVVIASPSDESFKHHLWIADTRSESVTPLTTGTNDELDAKASPDGRSILYSLATIHADVSSVSLEDGATKTVITTGHDELDAAWSANKPKLVWATTRNGRPEIWVRMADGSERPLITPAEFPNGAKLLTNPLLSPDGERVIYVGPDSGTGAGTRLWISSVNGGTPVQLTNRRPNDGYELSGSWSPDGSRFVYVWEQPDNWLLMMVKTSGNAKPVVLKGLISGWPDCRLLANGSYTASRGKVGG